MAADCMTPALYRAYSFLLHDCIEHPERARTVGADLIPHLKFVGAHWLRQNGSSWFYEPREKVIPWPPIAEGE